MGPVFSGFDSPRAPYYPIILFLRTSYLGDFIGTFVVTTWPGHGHGQQVLTRIQMGVFKIQVNWMKEPKNASSFIYNKYVNCLVRVLAYLQRVQKSECWRGVFIKRKKRVASEIRWKWDEMKHEGRICT